MKKPTIHLICNAHLDPVWQWQWEEGAAEALATFGNAIKLLKEYDELIFNHNEAVLYQWVQKYDPALFRQIRKLVRKGRWFISGGWYLQPDINLSGIESIIRHIQLGRKYFQKYFNVVPRVAYNFDSFGHGGGLPQILKKSGYEMYIHMRPQQEDLQLPSDLYWWEGVDGSRILTYRIVVGLYHTEYDNIVQRLEQGVELALNLHRNVPVFWGIGNHGGGATREDLEKIEEFRAKEYRVNIIHSTPDYFYESIKVYGENAPLVRGDLQRVFTGCYTSLSRLKRAANQNLQKLLQAESLRTVTWWIYGYKFPFKKIESTWRSHLFNDFHDILPGSCTEPAEKDALNLYSESENAIREMNLNAAVCFNRGKKKNEYLPITILNTNSGLGLIPLEVEFMISHRPKWSGKWHVELYNSEGDKIICQEEQPEALLPFNGWRRKISFLETFPAFGVRHYAIKLIEGQKKPVPKKPGVNFKLNRNTGLIKQIYLQKELPLLKGDLLQPVVFDDKADSWGTGYRSYPDRIGEFQTDPGSIRIVEQGPVRTIHESIMQYNNSRIVLHTIAYSKWSVLEFRISVFWLEERKRLKLIVPTVFRNRDILCEIPGGIIRRPADGDIHVHGRWLMLSEKIEGKDAALGVAHVGMHGLEFKDGIIELSVLRSAAYCHEQGLKLDDYPARKFMDQGKHEIRLALITGNKNNVLTKLTGLADWLAAPPLAYAHLPLGSFSKNKKLWKIKKPVDQSDFLKICPQNIRLTSLKPSKDKKALILRLQETGGKKSAAKIKIQYPEIEIKLNFAPLEIKTIRIERQGDWREANLISES